MVAVVLHQTVCSAVHAWLSASLPLEPCEGRVLAKILCQMLRFVAWLSYAGGAGPTGGPCDYQAVQRETGPRAA